MDNQGPDHMVLWVWQQLDKAAYEREDLMGHLTHFNILQAVATFT
jgi:hypothetical protein